jgi:phosphoribosyl 1,2-cyclic phosphodiesterase
LDLTFWGVRGGMPAPGAATAGFGGNSPCIELRLDGRLVIFDAGTGLRALGKALMARSPVSGDLLFSHTNFNRICGLPFFAAAFHPRNRFGFWCGHRPEEGSIKAVLTRLMTDPVFPVPIDIFNADLVFHDFHAGEAIDLGGGLSLATYPVNSGMPGTAYRLGHGGASVCHACTVRPDGDLAGLIDFATGVDLLVLSLLDDDLARADRTAARIARKAGIRHLVVTDHAPEQDDPALAAREHALQAAFPATTVAREGTTMTAGAEQGPD